MNYLAHIYLSKDNKELQFGNFIADAVKGNSYNKYPETIAEGILMHRAIDSYTDNHDITRESLQLLRPELGRYSPVVLDIFFDYLLANNFDKFSDVPLKQFTEQFYETVAKNYNYLPNRIKEFIWHFIHTDRLAKYAHLSGIKESLDIMVHYRNVDIDTDKAIELLVDKEEILWDRFVPFFEDLHKKCKNHLNGNTELSI